MVPPEFSKRDFLKAASLTALAYGWKSVNPAPAFAEAVREVYGSRVPNWDSIRDQFPLTHDRVYFNNGTFGPSPTPVIEAIAASLKEIEIAAEPTEASSIALRIRLADFIGARPDEIALTHNTTDGVNIVAGGLRLAAGDEVILTTHEHVGGALPWLNRARLDGVVLKPFSPASTAEEVLRQIDSLISSRTRVIAVPHLSCTTGQVFPLAEIVKLARSKGILIFVDGAHGTGMLSLDLHALGVDFYASSTHKWLCGPKGVGYLYVRKDRFDEIEPIFVGAYSDSGWSLESHPPRIVGFNPTAHRFDYGSQNSALYDGAVAAIDFFEKIGMKKITEHGCTLALGLQNELLKLSDSIEMLTPTEDRSRAMMVSFRFRDSARASTRFANFAVEHGFRVRQVSEASMNAIRISTHLYNSADEVDRFLAVVRAFLLRR